MNPLPLDETCPSLRRSLRAPSRTSAGGDRRGVEDRCRPRGRGPVRLASRHAVLRDRGKAPPGRLRRVPARDSAVLRAREGSVRLVLARVPDLAGTRRACTVLVAALVARDLGGSARAQTLAAVAVAFSPGSSRRTISSSRSRSTSSRRCSSSGSRCGWRKAAARGS